MPSKKSRPWSDELFFTPRMLARHLKKTLILSLPISVGQLGHILMSVVDNIMIGKAGVQALAAASIANALFTLIMVTGLGLTMAGTPLTAIAYGAGRDTECGVVLRQGLIVNLLCGVVLCALTFATAGCIRFLNQPEEIVPGAVVYMQVLGLSLLPIMLFQSYRQFAEGVSYLKPAMVITLLANLVNILANWMFIFGNLGMPAMGLTGAGIATFSSRTFMAVALMAVIMRSSKMKRFDPSLRYKKIDIPMMKRFFAIGIPGACQYFFEVSAFAAASVMVGWMGALPLAAHQIALNLAFIPFMIALGISAASTIRVGNAVGKKDRLATREAGFSAVLLCGVFMIFSGLVFIGFRHVLPTFYITDKQVIDMCAGLLIIVAFFQVSDGTQAVGLGMLRGITDMKIPTYITLSAYWLVGLPSGYVFAFIFDFGIFGVWYGLLASLSVSAILLMLRFHNKTR